MRKEYVLLTIARLYQVKQRVEAIQITDPSLVTLRKELCAIADAIHSLPRERYGDKNCKALSNEAEFVAEMLLYLEEHVLYSHNSIIRQVIVCLAHRWGVSKDSNILLFVRGNFAVKHYQLFANPLQTNIFYAKYKVNISKEVRLVYIPAFYDDDFLFSSILFHEVGHMVERQYSIGELIFQELSDLLKTKSNPRIIRKYFSSLIDSKGKVDDNKLKQHIKEYVADIFACQYLGEHTLHYLRYREGDDRKADRSDHPTYENREKLVYEFVRYMNSPAHYTDNDLIKMMVKIYENTATIENLGKKYLDLDTTPLLQGQAVPINNEEELFSLFSGAWNLGIMDLCDIEKLLGMPEKFLSVNDYYSRLNEGMKVSIINALRNIQ